MKSKIDKMYDIFNNLSEKNKDIMLLLAQSVEVAENVNEHLETVSKNEKIECEQKVVKKSKRAIKR